MVRYMPKLEAYFHYRNLDVSTLKELPLGAGGEEGFQKKTRHTALADVYESIDELKHYRDHFIRLPQAVPATSAGRDELTAGAVIEFCSACGSADIGCASPTATTASATSAATAAPCTTKNPLIFVAWSRCLKIGSCFAAVALSPATASGRCRQVSWKTANRWKKVPSVNCWRKPPRR